jgi:hypothetical protein
MQDFYLQQIHQIGDYTKGKSKQKIPCISEMSNNMPYVMELKKGGTS